MRNRPSAEIKRRVCLGKAGSRRDDNPATVDYLREQAPYSQYNGYSLRRDRCSLDSTLQEGNWMTICSWRTQSPKSPQKLDCHAKLPNSQERHATSSVYQDRYAALCQNLNFDRSIPCVDVSRFVHRADADDTIVILQSPGGGES